MCTRLSVEIYLSSASRIILKLVLDISAADLKSWQSARQAEQSGCRDKFASTTWSAQAPAIIGWRRYRHWIKVKPAWGTACKSRDYRIAGRSAWNTEIRERVTWFPSVISHKRFKDVILFMSRIDEIQPDIEGQRQAEARARRRYNYVQELVQYWGQNKLILAKHTIWSVADIAKTRHWVIEILGCR
jgi:hypothetical protein